MTTKKTMIPTNNSIDKLIKLQVWIRRAIAFLFAILLMGLSAIIINDMYKIDKQKTYLDFVPDEYKKLETHLNELKNKQQLSSLELEKARDNLANQKNKTLSFQQEFNNWTSMRTATENSETNPEVRDKLNSLTEKRNNERDAQAIVYKIEQNVKNINNDMTTINKKMEELRDYAIELSNVENKRIALKIFWTRLLFCLPILASGIFGFIKFRNHKYSPLVWGYTWFSLYVFFVGLVPYLPSFGGYIRYLIGIIITVFGGIYAIKNFQLYMERRQIELERDKNIRASQIDTSNAILSYKNHTCPSCGQDYSISGSLKENEQTIKHCFQCGLELFKKCECGKLNFAFFSYCCNCGKEINKIDKS